MNDKQIPAPQPVPWHGQLLQDAKLTKSQQRVTDTLGLNPKFTIEADAAAVAARAGVNASTVVRTAQALGYSGWPDLQRELRAQYLVHVSREPEFAHHRTVASAVHDSLAQDARNLALASELIEAEKAAACIDALAGARRILCLGAGSHAAPSMAMAHLASVLGYPAVFEPRTGVHLAAALNTLGAGDVLFICHLWRPIRELAAAARIAARRGATVITITDLTSTDLASSSHHVLPVPSEGVFSFQSATTALSVVYGLLAGLEAHAAEAVRPHLVDVHELWNELGIYEF